jgi:eukaryotic-like serine/threonine-protein kinase
MSESRTCPNCGELRPANSPEGLCPICLLKQAIYEISDAPEGSEGPGSTLANTLSPPDERVSEGSTALHDEYVTHPPDKSDLTWQASFPEFVGRYRLESEIGHGGMGEVIKGRDVEIGREIALKVLNADFRDSPEMVLRFVEEGQIGGQLVHPAIVPVYEMGTFPDGRPFFVMKLVKGRTLMDLLKSRTDPAQDLPRYLSIFEQVCQAMAYAHSVGVIHRDLKPLNVMVGAFGEVQTMDWGLAKLLSSVSVPRSDSVIRTIREGCDDSVAGAVKGSYHFMPPEQARGEVDRLDERADVFALGAILCEILTGSPPYLGQSRTEVLDKAINADLANALARLDACGADAELPALARHCMAPDRDDRPRDAGEVAASMADYFASVQDRLRKAELDRVEAETRAQEEAKRRVLADELANEAESRAASERKRRRAMLALAASLLALVTMGGLGAIYYQQLRTSKATTLAKLIGEVSTLLKLAEAHAEDLAPWQTALAAVRQAEKVAVGEPEALRRLAVLHGVVEAGAKAAERDRILLDKIVYIHSARVDDLDGSLTDAAYAEAFREGELDLSVLPPVEVGAKIKDRPTSVAMALAASLESWASIRESLRNDPAGAGRLYEAVRAADLDPWRNDLRAKLVTADKDSLKDALKALAGSANLDEIGALNLNLLGNALVASGELTAAESVLRRAQRRHPGDLRANLDLASLLDKLNRRDDAIRFYTAARAILPETAHGLAHALSNRGDSDEAIEVFKDLARLRPKDGRILVCFATELKERGRPEEAAAALEQAIVTFREAIRLRPGEFGAHLGLGDSLRQQGKLDDAIAAYREVVRLRSDYEAPHHGLGDALSDQRKFDEAIAEYRVAIRLRPNDAEAHSNLGMALREQGKLDEAIAEQREAIRLRPNDAQIRSNLGGTLNDQKKFDEAVAECREAIKLKPNLAIAHFNLAHNLKDQGKLDEAIAAYREAIRLNPDLTEAHTNLGSVLASQGKLTEALGEHRKAIRLKPDDADVHNCLGAALSQQGNLEGAIAEFRKAIRLNPDLAVAHYNLGTALNSQGMLDEAVAELRKAIRLQPVYPEAYNNLGIALNDQGKLDDAVIAYRQAIRIWPDFAVAYNGLGNALSDQRKFDQAIAAYRQAIRLQPEFAFAHNGLGIALKNQGKLDQAVAAYREAIRFQPEFAMAHYNLGGALNNQGKLDDAIAAYSEAIRLQPEFAFAHNNLGIALSDQGKLDQAVAAYRQAIRLQPEFAFAHNNLGNALKGQGKLDQAVVAYRQAIRLQPDYAAAHKGLGNALWDQGELDQAVAAYREAIRLDPDYAEAHCDLGLALRKQGDYAGGLAMLLRGHELGSKRPDWRYPSAQWVTRTERMVALADRLPAVARGDDRPGDIADRLTLASMCYDTKRFAAAARLWADALEADPKLGQSRQPQHRYNAACAASLAAAGQGKDDRPPDDAAKAKLRGQALDWLKAELVAWANVLDSGPAEMKAKVESTLQHWKADTDLVGIRDADTLAKLPDSERKECQALWAEVDALLAKANSGTPKP